MIFSSPLNFEWDIGNLNKNLLKHGVSNFETEEVFFDADKKILKDILHSKGEERFILIGKTKLNRILFIVFTIRDEKLRIISARDINKKEVFLYEKRIKT